MKTVEVSESALESLKAMVEQLQSERDEALMHLTKCATHLGPSHNEVFMAREFIAKCTQTQSICDWQEKMNG